jgi:hypothetical protein
MSDQQLNMFAGDNQGSIAAPKLQDHCKEGRALGGVGNDASTGHSESGRLGLYRRIMTMMEEGEEVEMERVRRQGKKLTKLAAASNSDEQVAA